MVEISINLVFFLAGIFTGLLIALSFAFNAVVNYMKGNK